MAVYVTKKCPHCGHAYQFLNSGDQRKYGCPYQTCMVCKKKYWDADIKEPALHGFKNFYETKGTIVRGFTCILYGTMGIASLYGGFSLLMDEELIGFVLIALGAFCVWGVCSFFKQLYYDRKNKDAIIATQQMQYDDSMTRLQDTYYLMALAEIDPKAKKLLQQRMNGDMEKYAQRPE